MVSLFELQDGKIILNEICYTSKTLKEIQKVFKKDKNYMKVYTYLFYLTCPDKKKNPFWDIAESEKEEFLSHECEIDFSLDEPAFNAAREFCEKLYTTPTKRFFLDCKIGIEKQGEYLRKTTITFGRDGNDSTYLAALKSMGSISSQFAQVQKMFDDEVGSSLRGGGEASYDEN